MRTSGGDKPIEKVRVGDRVLAKDMVTGKTRLRKVTRVASHLAAAMMALTIAGTATAGTATAGTTTAGTTIRVTTEHPFHTPDRGWVNSTDLKVGDLNRPGFRGGSVTWNQPRSGRVFQRSR